MRTLIPLTLALVLSPTAWAFAPKREPPPVRVSVSAISTDTTAIRTDVEAAFFAPAIIAELDKCVGTDKVVGLAVFERGTLKTLTTGSSIRTLEQCVTRALKKLAITTKTRVAVTFVVQPAQVVGTPFQTIQGAEKDVPVDAKNPNGLTSGDINTVMRSRAALFRACYQRELEKQPKLSGKFSLRFTIKGDGTVGDVSMASATVHNDALESCLKSSVARLTFPAKGSDATVTYPLVFSQAN